jgi:hypothetical protein
MKSKAETDHVSAKEAAARSKGKNASAAESGAGEAAAEPSTTKAYFATHASLDDAKRMVARYMPPLPALRRGRGALPKPTSLLVIRDSSTFLGIDRLRSGWCRFTV